VRVVHCEPLNCGTTSWRPSGNLDTGVSINQRKVRVPVINTRVEEWYEPEVLAVSVDDVRRLGFSSVAWPTCEGQVAEVIAATARTWLDMFDLESAWRD
jgi:hypothetical protein